MCSYSNLATPYNRLTLLVPEHTHCSLFKICYWFVKDSGLDAKNELRKNRSHRFKVNICVSNSSLPEPIWSELRSTKTVPSMPLAIGTTNICMNVKFMFLRVYLNAYWHVFNAAPRVSQVLSNREGRMYVPMYVPMYDPRSQMVQKLTSECSDELIAREQGPARCLSITLTHVHTGQSTR